MTYLFQVFFVLWSFFRTTIAQECVNWETEHPEWIHCDDFETEHDLSVHYADRSTNDDNFGVSDTDAFQGSYSLRQHYPLGAVDAGWISFFYCDALGGDYGDCYDTIYVRWYHKFETGFEGIPPKMARLSSIQSGWSKTCAVHYWSEGEENDYCIAADVRKHDMSWLPINRTNFKFSDANNIGRWVCLEMKVVQGENGGASRMGVNINGPYNYNNAMLDCYWNGGSPKEQNRYYDNFVLSTERIGCLDTNDGGDTTIDAAGCTINVVIFQLFVMLILFVC